jgi:hypothetical protein
MAQNLVKKLTVREIMGNKVGLLQAVRDMIAKGAGEVALCKVVGRTDKAKPGATDKGDFVRFYGEVVGVNLLTGERFQSGSVILPGAAESAIYGAIGVLDDKGHAEKTVEFALEIGAKYDEKSATQYVFTVRPLVEPRPSDPLRALLEASGVEKPALENKSEPASESSPEKEPARAAGGRKR